MKGRTWTVLAGVTALALLAAAAIGDSRSDGSAEGPAPEVTAGTPGGAADTARAKLAVRGMTCGSCATTARIALERVEGVHRAEVSYDSARAVVWYDPGKTSPERFIGRLREMTGYEASVVEKREPPGRRR